VSKAVKPPLNDQTHPDALTAARATWLHLRHPQASQNNFTQIIMTQNRTIEMHRARFAWSKKSMVGQQVWCQSGGTSSIHNNNETRIPQQA
jgi:hypothetical protein